MSCASSNHASPVNSHFCVPQPAARWGSSWTSSPRSRSWCVSRQEPLTLSWGAGISWWPRWWLRQRPKEYFYWCTYGPKQWCSQGSADSMFFFPRFWAFHWSLTNNILNADGAEKHVELTTHLCSMSQKFQDHLTPRWWWVFLWPGDRQVNWTRRLLVISRWCAKEHILVRCPWSGGDQDVALTLSLNRSAAGRPIILMPMSMENPRWISIIVMEEVSCWLTY